MENENTHQILFEINKLKEKHDDLRDYLVNLIDEINIKTDEYNEKIIELEKMESDYVLLIEKLNTLT